MRRTLRVVTTLIVGFVTAASATTTAEAVAGPSQVVTTAVPGPILQACHHLQAGTTNDRLVNGGFELTVYSDSLTLWQTVQMNGSAGPDTYGEPTWAPATYDDFHAANNHRTKLAFYCNGDLVFGDSAGVLWRAGTAGRGGVRLALTNSGNLLMLNAAGSVVWQLGTGRAIMAANSILPSNSRLVSRAGNAYGNPTQTLSMQTDGNLVYREGSTVRWQTRTRVPGSRAALTTKAELLVLSPAGTVLWRSGRTGTSYSTFL
ncbi:MAG: hypothetical protein ACRCY9_16515, partial [Phycicoccus sp.]